MREDRKVCGNVQDDEYLGGVEKVARCDLETQKMQDRIKACQRCEGDEAGSGG